MSDYIQALERLLDKYQFRKPVPDAAKIFFSQNKLKALVSTLKDANEFNVFYGMVLKIHSIFSKSGLGISVIQSRIILGIISLISGIALTAGAVFSINLVIPGTFNFSGKGIIFQNDTVTMNNEKQLSTRPGEDKEQKTDLSVNSNMRPGEKASEISNNSINTNGIHVNRQKGNEKIESINKKTEIKISGKTGTADSDSLSNKNMTLGVNRITANGVDEKIAEEITNKIYAGLCGLKNKNGVYLGDNIKRKKTGGNQLIGSINKLGNRYLLTIAVLDGKTGEHIFDSSFSFNRDASIETELKDLINQISGNKEIWLEQKN